MKKNNIENFIWIIINYLGILIIQAFLGIDWNI